MNLKDFFKKWDGKTIDFDGVFNFQCKDYTNQYTKEVFGIESPKGNAEDMFNKDWGSMFEKHINTPDFIPIAGDVVIWNGNHCKYGHIGIVISADINSMVISDQNSGTGNGDGKGNNKIRQHKYTYKNVIGFIRHKSLIIKEEPMKEEITTYTYKGLTYPLSILGIPVVMKKTDSDTLMGYSSIVGYTPQAVKNEIWIFENSFTKGQDYLLKVINHELFHFYQHLVFSKEQNKYIEDLFKFIPDKVSDYSATLFWEDGAETYAYGKVYIEGNKKLPENKLWNEAINFKYQAYKKFVDSRNEELIKLINK